MARITILGQGFVLVTLSALDRLRLGSGNAGAQLGAGAGDSDPDQPVFSGTQRRRGLEQGALRPRADPGPDHVGREPVALDPPSDDEVMRALEKARPVEGGWPMLYERNRNNVRIVKYKIADYVDPPRVYPLVGPAQQHHAHYKCIIYFEDVRHIGWPVPYTITRR